MGATTHRPAPAASTTIPLPTVGLPMWAVVGISRVLVLVVSVGAALFGVRAAGWAQFDPGQSTLHLGRFGNLLAASADRWDAIHYLHIAEHGYTGKATTVFYPLYPLLIRLLSPVTGSYVIAGAAISLLSFVIAMVLLHRLTVEELGVDAASVTILLLAFAPLSFFFTAIYTESLFLAVTVGAFYAARHGRWKLAALLAAAATATRVPGILVVAGVLYTWWRSGERPRSALIWFALSTLPLAAFSIYLDLHGFGLLGSVQNQSGYGRSMVTPIGTMIRAFEATIRWSTQAIGGGPLPTGIGSPLPVPIFNMAELVVLVISLFALIGVWKLLPKSYAIYTSLAMTVCLWSSFTVEPLKSFDRFVLTMFPLWMIAGAWLAKRRQLLPLVVSAEIVALIFYTHQFAIWRFVA